MRSSEIVLVVAVFLASAVEMVEALTIILAVGITRGWRTALEGMIAAFAVLAAIVIAFGPALVRYVPLDLLRSVVGVILLIFGLQWLRKAIFRASGLKMKRNEDAVFESQVRDLSLVSPQVGRDMVGFTVAFKGVFIEGLEVVIIVLTLGSSSHNLGLASFAAVAAILVVAAVGLAVSRQLSSVPENAMKLSVGLMLVSFGTFWGGEGLGLAWPGSDLMIPVLLAVYGTVTFLMVKLISTRRPVPTAAISKGGDAQSAGSAPAGSWPIRAVRGFLHFWWDFLVGDTPELFVGTLLIVGVLELLQHAAAPMIVEVVMVPLLVLVLLNGTVLKEARSAQH